MAYSASREDEELEHEHGRVNLASVTVVGDERGASAPVAGATITTTASTSVPGVRRRHKSLGWQRSRALDPSQPELSIVHAPVEAVQSAASPSWMRSYLRNLVALDASAAIIAGLVAFGLRFGAAGTASDSFRMYGTMALLFPVVWVATIGLSRGYDSRVIGAGPEEYQRVSRSVLLLVAVIGLTSYTLKADLARGFVFVALPLALAIGLVLRYAARKRLHVRRSRGQAVSSIVIVGRPSQVADLAVDLRRERSAGLNVVGACVPGDDNDPAGFERLAKMGIDILGDVDDIKQIVNDAAADVVAVTSSVEVGPDRLRWIAWQLEETTAELAVSPGLVDVAGTRINVRLAAGLPLLYVEAPRFSGPHKALKGCFDRAVAGMALLILSPVLLVLAACVRFGSKGPAFFRQTRVGKNGKTFTMVKFRSMYSDAEARLDELAGQNDNADGLLFKMRDDPRVTRIGKVLRRYSLDELPQLINIVTGSMSLVGPRPPLPKEVGLYGEDVRRRLLVKPGLTGLWQVSGRSDLSWEDSVRLDLRYVENWSLTMDLQVLWKTGRAVLGASGAY